MYWAASAYFVSDYPTALEIADRVLAAAERVGDARVAAEALRTKGNSAFNLGRLWELRALLMGSQRVAQEAGLQEPELRAVSALATVLALDSPAAALAQERDAIALARRLGQRQQEIVITQNAVEDARRVGDWDWCDRAIAEIDQYDIDAAARLENRIQQAMMSAWRGDLSEDALEALRAAAAEVEDRGTEAAIDDLKGIVHTVEGRFVEAAASWIRLADASDLNAPYALPRAGRAAVLGGDAQLARSTLDRLAALGSRGRAIDADRTTIRAGLAALAGDHTAALDGYRSAAVAYRELGLAFDEALLGIEAARLIGVEDPEVGAWVETARATLARIRVDPLLAALDRAVARSAAGGGVAVG